MILLWALQEGGVAAKVNEHVITWDDVKEELGRLGIKDEYEQVKYAYLRQIVLDKVLSLEAQKLSITISDKEVQKAIDMEKQLIGEERFNQILAKLKRTYKQYFKQRKMDMLAQKIYSHKFISTYAKVPMYSIPVSSKEIKEFYLKNRKLFEARQEAEVMRIVLKYKNKIEKKQKITLARSLLRKLKEYTDFAFLAGYYSETSIKEKRNYLLGRGIVLKKGESGYSSDIENCIFEKMQKGAVNLFDTGKSIQIIKVNKVTNRKARSFEQAQSEIRRLLEQRKFEEIRRRILKKIIKDYYIYPEDLFEP
jgi:hypothetical protein